MEKRSITRRRWMLCAGALLVTALAMAWSHRAGHLPGLVTTAAARAAAPDAAPPVAAPVAPPARQPIALTSGRAATVSLLAGDGHAGLRDGAALQARFADPYGLAIDAGGTLYISDGGDNNRIRRLNPDGRVSTFVGGDEGFRDGPAGQAAFNTPSGLAFDAQGNLLVADTGNHAIRKIAPDGTVTTLAGDGQAGFRDGPSTRARFNSPLALTVDAQGRVLVADAYNDRIRAIAPDGQVSTLAGGDAPGFRDGPAAQALFDTPCGLAVDAAGNVWVADTGNQAIRKIEAGGQVTTLVQRAPGDDASPLRRPVSIVAAPNGLLYVGMLRSGALLQVSPSGELHPLVSADTGGTGWRFARPTGLVLDPAGDLLVSDAAAGRVHRVARAPEAQAASVLTGPTAESALAGPRAESVLAGPIGPADDAALPATAHRWPLRPQLGGHEVVGMVGEVRGNDQGESRDHLHDGLDIRGDVGAAVVAIADGKVSSPFAAGGFGKLGEGLTLDALTYVHVQVGRDGRGQVFDPLRFHLLRDAAGQPERVRVARGTRFKAGDRLGSVNAMAHVHLTLGATGFEHDALALGFEGFADHQPPHIDGITLLDDAGHALTRRAGPRLIVPRDTAGLRIVVDAWDQVDGNLPRRRLGLRTLGYQLLRADGRPADGFEAPRTTLDFTRLPANDEAVKRAYAADSGITVYGSARTRFLYEVTNTVQGGMAKEGRWSVADLPPGDYTLRILARDFAGNLATRHTDLALRIP